MADVDTGQSGAAKPGEGTDRYNENFLGVPVPLPRFKHSLVNDVLSRAELRDGVYADYVYYTVAMHREFRTPLFAALNIDNSKRQKTTRESNWDIDSRIGAENQLNNDYYRRNHWDRGHLAMRHAAAWGQTGRLAQRAADETFYYTNAALQHENFNQDEWLALEKWVTHLPDAQSGRICEFSGPIFGDFMRTVRPVGRPVAYVPSAFFKVIAFLDKVGELQVRAFLIHQDDAALADKSGKKTFNNQIYQVAVARIEELTGLEFDDSLAAKNPIWFSDSEKARAVTNVTSFPEYRDINGTVDIVNAETDARPNAYRDDEVPIFIAGAMVNPKGNEAQGEWVSLINLSGETISIEGWEIQDKVVLKDGKRRTVKLTGEIGAGEARRIQPLSPVRLLNNPDDEEPGLIILNDADGNQIDRVSYRKKDLPAEGQPVIFAYTYTD